MFDHIHDTYALHERAGSIVTILMHGCLHLDGHVPAVVAENKQTCNPGYGKRPFEPVSCGAAKGRRATNNQKVSRRKGKEKQPAAKLLLQ